MVARAFVLIETAVGRTKEVANALKQLEGVKSVDPVTGPYDVIAVIELGSLTEIGDLVTSKIHPIPGIARTVTCLAI
jgi:DNA-binding Lrp family transcriptional regulator